MQEAKSNPKTLGNNRPKSTLTDLRLIYTQIRKKIYKTKATESNYIYRVKPFLKHFNYVNVINDKCGNIGIPHRATDNHALSLLFSPCRIFHSGETSQIPVRRKVPCSRTNSTKKIFRKIAFPCVHDNCFLFFDPFLYF